MFHLRNRDTGALYLGWDEKPKVFADRLQAEEELTVPDQNETAPFNLDDWELVAVGQRTIALPEGFADIEIDDNPMVGTMLKIRLNNGRIIMIDALNLGQQEVQICVYEKPEGGDEHGALVGGLSFDAEGEVVL